jgi:hypothetical protein
LQGGSGKRFDDDRRNAGHLKAVAEPRSTRSESVFQAQAFFNPDGHYAHWGVVSVSFKETEMQSSFQTTAIFGDGVTCQTPDELEEYLQGISETKPSATVGTQRRISYGHAQACKILAFARMGKPSSFEAMAQSLLEGKTIHPMHAAQMEREVLRLHSEICIDERAANLANVHLKALFAEHGFFAN